MALANDVLNQFKSHSDAWLTVPVILEHSHNVNSQFLGLQILDEAVNVSPNILTLLDSLANIRWHRQGGNQELPRAAGDDLLRSPKQRALVLINQVERHANFHRQVRMAHLVAELYPRHLQARKGGGDQVRKRAQHPTHYEWGDFRLQQKPNSWKRSRLTKNLNDSAVRWGLRTLLLGSRASGGQPNQPGCPSLVSEELSAHPAGIPELDPSWLHFQDRPDREPNEVLHRSRLIPQRGH